MPQNRCPRTRSARTAILILALPLLLGQLCQSGNTTPPPDDTDTGQLSNCPTNATRQHVLVVGEPTVTVVEYIDIQCPVCGRFARDTYPTIKEQYIDTGKVRWIFRHFPLSSIHASAQAAAEASECAHQQGRFFDFVDLAYNNQSNLTSTGLKGLASQLGLDRSCFDECLDGGGEAARVREDFDAGVSQNVNGTPTFFINNSKTIGFQSVAQFSALLDAAIADAE